MDYEGLIDDNRVLIACSMNYETAVTFTYGHFNKVVFAVCASTSVVSTPGNRRCTLAIATSSISVILKIRADLKFSVSGWSKQASKQASIHTHVCNEVTLVWGSLRLAPIRVCSKDLFS